MKFSKNSFAILKPAAAGVAGFAAAKLVNKIPMGSGKTLGDDSLIAGVAKIAVGAFAPGILGNKVPLVNEVALGVAIAGVHDLAMKLLPASVTSYLAGPGMPKDYMIACPPQTEVKYQ